MRLRRLDLTRYGRFTDHAVDFGERIDGRPDLHLIYGPNEAGKSTAFAGFLDLLFGIEPQSRFNFLHPYPTMQVGACLELSGGVRELVLLKRAAPSLRDAAGEPVADGVIVRELGGLDRASYRMMFSLDDNMLAAGGESILASNGELGQLLFSATAGLSELSGMLQGVRQEAERFTRSHARGTDLQRMKTEIAALKQQREESDIQASVHRRLAMEAKDAGGRYDAVQAERAAAQAALARTRRLLDARPRLAALDELAERLGPLAGLPDAPPGWLDELPELEQAEKRHRSETE